jgi:GEVED domain/Pregnancy-associated plasma protein-A/PKD domain/Secretion system C-terminal sorting domain
LIMRKIFVGFLSFFVFPLSLIAQDAIQVVNPFSASYAGPNGTLKCYTDEIAHQQFKNNPEFRRNFYENERKIQEYMASNSRVLFDSGIRHIPTVFHIIHLPGTPVGTAENISMGQIESQIRIFNEDFRKIAGTNGDGNGVDTKLDFFLAQKDPLGNCTDGVNRVGSTLTNHTPSQATALKALSYWPSDKYFNVWVVRDMGGILGYATFPGGTPTLDGIVVVDNAIGDEGQAASPYGLGHTAVHEAGHWMNLFHTFQGGCPNGNCNTQGDRVCDTPPVDNPNFGCPVGHNSCGGGAGNGPDLIDNYMDYTDDVCMSMFTAGQSLRMDASVAATRSLLVDSINVVNAGYYGCLGIIYCNSASSDSSSVQITNVSFETVNNSSGPICQTYTDFTDQFDQVIRDSTFNFSVSTAACGGATAGSHKVVAFFDWNRDADFEDPGEEVLIKSYGPSVGTSIISVTVPDTAVLDRTGIRVIVSKDTAVSPCGIYPFGETEDYSIQIRNNPPSITEFYPDSGQAGTLVTIIGSKFEGVSDVKFNGVSVFAFTYISSDTMTALAPSSTTGTITVESPTGFDVSDSVFTYLVFAPQITSFSPDSALVGTIVDIYNQGTGTTFTGYTDVEFNGTPVISSTGMASTWIRTAVPPGATTGKIKVLHPNGDAISVDDFLVMQPIPTISISALPGAMCPGETTSLTFNMTGSGLYFMEYTDGTDTIFPGQISSGYQIQYTLNSTTTFTVISLSDANHANPNPNASKTITVYGSPIAGFNPSANGLNVTFLNTSSGALDYQWDFGDGGTSIGANPLHTYATAGTYNVCLIALTNNSCPDTICQTISITVGLENSLQDGYFNAYPNPVTDLLNFELELQESGVARLELIALDGKTVGQQDISIRGILVQGTLDMRGLSAGTYLLKLTTPNGQQVINKIQKN